jgi:hypothetical protein
LESIRHLMLYGKRCKHSREERGGEDKGQDQEVRLEGLLGEQSAVSLNSQNTHVPVSWFHP